MNLLISVASPELHVIDYSGNAGCYSACTPDGRSIYKINELVKFLGLPPNPEKYHCTLMYSKEHPIDTKGLDFKGKRFKAQMKEVRYWDGHDNAGYIVLSLKSNGLHEAHKELKDRGAIHSFDEFEPHITLYKGQQITKSIQNRINIINERFLKTKINLGLTNWFVGDIKDD